MSDEYEVDTHKRLYLNNEGVFIEFAPHPEGFGEVLRTTDKKSKEWFGAIELSVHEDGFIALANMILDYYKEK